MTLDELRRYKPQIFPIADKYGAREIRVCGSVARDEARTGSDVDILINLPSGSLWDRLSMKHEIEDLLHQSIDLLADDSLTPRIRPSLLKEARDL